MNANTFGKSFILGILAGASIALGGTAFLSLESKLLGACFFCIGLFAVCTMGFRLYTGKVCYVFEKDRAYALDLIPIWLGNLCGAWLVAFLEAQTRIAPGLQARAAELAEAKLSDGILSVFLLAVFCNICIYIAVDGYAKNPHELGKYLSLFFGVTVFILCGFEHCVANMYYFSMAGAWSLRALGYILLMTAGNSLGGVCLPLLRRAAGI